MELDDFKDQWNNAAGQSAALNYDIPAMLRRESKGPLAALEKNLKISLYIFPFVAVWFAGHFISPDGTQSPTMLLLFAILFIEFLFSVFNYIVVKKIQIPGGNLRENLLKRIFLLQNRYRNFLYVHQGLYALMAVLLELVMRYHLDARFDGWARVNLVIRISVYVIFIIVQFILKRNTQKKYYGQYLDKLNTLVEQIG